MKSTSNFSATYSRSYEHIAPAQSGDICALLVPSYRESSLLKARLTILRDRFGGEIAQPLHLTCQRFSADEAQLQALKPRLVRLVSKTTPLQLTGKQIEPFYSTFREQEILKCRINESSALENFVDALTFELEELGIEPHFPWVSELVTLLEDIQIGRLATEIYPGSLFAGHRLVLTKIIAPGRYKALFSASLSRVLEPSLKTS